MGPLFTVLFALTARSVLSSTEGKRVVVFPMPHASHTKYHINVAQELVKLGHDVWLTMPEYLVAKGVLNTSSLKIVEYATKMDVEKMTMRASRDRYFSGEGDCILELFAIMNRFSEEMLTNDSFFQVIKNIRPQLIIIDNVLIKMFSIIPYRLGVPFAFVGSVFDPTTQRIPFSPAMTPISILPYSDLMDFTRRLITTVVYLIASVHDFTVYSDAVATFAPEMPYLPMDMLVLRAEIWLVETDHILDYPRPSIPNVKLIGGTATGPPKPLPAQFQSFMDGATQGVVIVSFGSYVLRLPKEVSDKVLEVLLKLPLKAVLRSNLTSPNPTKILTAPWIPQNDLLAHGNTKVFVSHCGKNGQYEALYHAVPIVATPMFIDQPYNAERARIKGFSETVDLKTTSSEEMRKVIMKVATEKRYKQAISKASKLFRIEFGVPRERAAFWLDHVMKYGGAHMRSAGQDMPYHQFLGLDILVFLTVMISIFCFVLAMCCFLSFRWTFCRKRKEKEA